MKSITRRHGLLALAILGGLASAATSLAGIATWAGVGKASVAENWDPQAVPIAGDHIVLDASATGNMEWDLDIAVASWTQDGYTGTVTFDTVYGSTGFTNFVVNGNVVLNTGAWTHQKNAKTEVYRLCVTVGGDMTVGAAGVISADGLGFQTGYSKYGARISLPAGMGGSYGGPGGYNGIDLFFTAEEPLYGSAISPESLGCGGTYLSKYGGGAIKLTVTESLTLEGTIHANSQTADYYVGSGGSVYIIAGSLSGGGTLAANSKTTGHTTGSGGRIAVVLTGAGADFSNYDIIRLASSLALKNDTPHTGSNAGAPGTIYFETAADNGRGTLVLKGVGQALRSGHKYMYMNPFGAEIPSLDFSRIVLTNAAMLRVVAGHTLDLTDTAVMDGGNASALNGICIDGGDILTPAAEEFAFDYALVSETDNIFDSPLVRILAGGSLWVRGVAQSLDGDLTLESGARLIGDADFSISGDLLLKNGATNTCTVSGTGVTDVPNKLVLTVGGDMTLQPGAAVDVTGKGYRGARGPGYDGQTGGGAHGGLGRIYDKVIGKTYGSVRYPTDWGSATSGSYDSKGGGVILLAVAGALQNGGDILANGEDQQYYPGAGGSINLAAKTLSGSGAIAARGGKNTANHGGAGGGRVAIRLTDAAADFSTYSGTINAYGSAPISSYKAGGAGTVYLQTGAQAEGEGTLVIAHSGSGVAVPTAFPASLGETDVGDVRLLDGAQLLLQSNATLDVSGDWTNGNAVLSGEARSTVAFTGDGTSTISGNNTFHGLACATPGKTLAFQAGSRQSIGGTLRLEGDAADLVTLASTDPGAAWELCLLAPDAQAVSRVAVQDSDALSGLAVTAANSQDNGDNDNWDFTSVAPGAAMTWTGAAGSGWGNVANWNPARVPVPTDNILIPGGAAHMPALMMPTRVADLTVGAGASLALDGFDLAVQGDLDLAGALVAAAAETLVLEGDVSLGGSFTAARSTVLLAGSSAQAVVASSKPVFWNLSVATASSVTFNGDIACDTFRCEGGAGVGGITFQAGTTLDTRLFKVRGEPSARIPLGSTSPGAAWGLRCLVHDVSGVSVSDSDASSGVPVFPADSVDDGQNTNWCFSDTRTAWVGSADPSFGLPANWSGGQVPTADTEVYIGDGGTILIEAAPVVIRSLAIADGATVTVRTNLAVTGAVILEAGGTLVWDVPGGIGTDLVVLDGGTLTHSPNATTEACKIALEVAGGGYIAAGGTIDATGKGYAKAKGITVGAASSHGGRGAATGACYGSIVCPTNCGSGGLSASAGGGAIRLAFGKTLIVDGAIRADGEPDKTEYYSGTGGSILIETDALTGTGTLSAIGGRTYGVNWTSAGGRLAVKLARGRIGAFEGTLRAHGGFNPSLDPACTPGTVYTEDVEDKAGYGTILIDAWNSNTLGTDTRNRTDLPPSLLCGNPAETRNAAVVVQNGGCLNILQDAQLADLTLDGAKSYLKLNGHTLTLRTKEHPLGTVGTQITYDGGEIVWLPRDSHTLLILR